ncbi:MAG: hypothetical protein KAK00_00440 [Nanoarchaeota archaeon]|nr:hypothetical protein [Nanoarchaeota archaeon]
MNIAYRFGNFCPKTGADKPDCDIAMNAMYQLVRDKDIYKDDMIHGGADTVMMNCGNGNCGTAVKSYISLIDYIEKLNGE